MSVNVSAPATLCRNFCVTEMAFHIRNGELWHLTNLPTGTQVRCGRDKMPIQVCLTPDLGSATRPCPRHRPLPCSGDDCVSTCFLLPVLPPSLLLLILKSNGSCFLPKMLLANPF